jgi:hypothetical protein
MDFIFMPCIIKNIYLHLSKIYITPHWIWIFIFASCIIKNIFATFRKYVLTRIYITPYWIWNSIFVSRIIDRRWGRIYILIFRKYILRHTRYEFLHLRFALSKYTFGYFDILKSKVSRISKTSNMIETYIFKIGKYIYQILKI